MRDPHTCTRHKQGSRACYARHACRCQPCTTAASNWQQHQKAGLTARTSGSLILGHIGCLMDAGMTPVSIALAAGIPAPTLANLLGGRTRDVNRATAAKLLAVRIPTSPDRGWVPSIGTARRLQALSAIGWDSRALAAEVSLCQGRIETLRRGDPTTVHATVAARIAEVYSRLSMTPRLGWKADRSRTVAGRRGWQPPLAWDDNQLGLHGIDNPNGTPVPVTPDRKAERVASTIGEVEHLLVCGLSARVIAGQLGYDCPSSLAAWLRRHDRDDLANRFDRRAA